MFRKMPVLLLTIIILSALLDSYIPSEIKSCIYALSLTIKSVIVFALPFLIFMLLFKTLTQLSRSATHLIAIILLAVCGSNFLSTMISYQAAHAVYHFDIAIALPPQELCLIPAWSWNLQPLLANDSAMFAAIFLGILLSYIQPSLASWLSSQFEKAVNRLLQLLTWIIPLFVCGFVVKLVHDKILAKIIYEYSFIFFIVALSQFAYISLIYLVANRLCMAKAMTCIKNMLPAAIAGFCSMSSAATMPLTIIGTEKNTKGHKLARLAIPTTVNVHLVGDCFAIPIFAFAVMKNFAAVEPTFTCYMSFAILFVLAKFSVAAIPGGGIIVMLPILESQFGFTHEMSSLITALYILFDPVITCANVMGNGGFALALSNAHSWLQREGSSTCNIG